MIFLGITGIVYNEVTKMVFIGTIIPAHGDFLMP